MDQQNFCRKILSAGIDISSLPIKLIKIEKQVTYQEGTKSITTINLK